MKHLIIQMLIIIAPMMIATEALSKNDFGNPSFEIIANNQIFAANPLPTDPQGGCKATVSLEADIKGTSVCSSSNLLYYHITIDLNGDGIVDMIASSSFDPGYSNTWYLDSIDNKQKTYLTPDAKGDFKLKLPSFIVDAGSTNHKVLWRLSDNCGNLSESASTFMVVDKKAPTPFCVSISTVLFQINEDKIQLWAKDFDKGSFDNCTPPSSLAFTYEGVPPIYSRIHEEHFYKASTNGSVPATSAEYAQGKAYKWLPAARSAGFIWTCEDFFGVNVSVWDKSWNTDYCTIVVKGKCASPCTGLFNAKVKSVKNKGIKSAYVRMDANIVEFPKLFETDKTGNVSNIPLICYTPYTASAEYNDGTKAGIDKVDLNLLNAHLAGKKVFKYAWQYIAADLNNDGVITASDAATLANWLKDGFEPKWKIFVADEKLTVDNWNTHKSSFSFMFKDISSSIDFVALKMGDINGDVFGPELNESLPEIEIPSSDSLDIRNQNSLNTTFKAFPNPFYEQTSLQLSLSKAQNVNLYIYDVSGTIVFSKTYENLSGNVAIPISDAELPQSGIYYCRLSGAFGDRDIKLVKLN